MTHARTKQIGLATIAFVSLASGALAQVGYEWGREFDSPHMGTGEIIDSVVFDDGSGPALYLCGAFREIHGEACFSVVKFDGTDWTPLGGGLFNFNNAAQVRALEVYDADGAGPGAPLLVAAGEFSTANGTSTIVNNVAAWNGTTWSPLGQGISGAITGQGSAEVWDLKMFDDGSGPKLYACGIFTIAGFRGMGVWDGSSWGPMAGTAASSGWGMAMEVLDDGSGPALYVGGNFGAIVGTLNTANLARWNGTSFSSLGPVFSEVQGLTGFDPDGAGPMTERLVASGGGSLEVWDGNTMTPVAGFSAGLTAALTSFDDGSGPAVYLGANDIYTNAGSRMHRWDGVSASMTPVGSVVGQYITVAFMETLFVHEGEMYAGGYFGGTDSAPSHGYLKWDGTDWIDPFPRKGLARYNPLAGGSGANDAVLRGVVAYDSGSGEELFVGGIITHAGSVQVSQDLAAYDGNSWREPGQMPFTGFSSNTRPMGTWDDGTGEGLYVAVQQGADSAVYRLDPGGWSVVGNATPHIPGLPVGMTSFNDGTGDALYMASRKDIRKWDGTTWTVVGSVPSNSINQILTYGSGASNALYIGGFFTSINGVAASRMARFDGSTWTSVAGSPTSSTVVNMVKMDDGSGPSLFVSGPFSSVAGVPGTAGVARWDGTNWFSVGGGVGSGTWKMLGSHNDGSTTRLYGTSLDIALSSQGSFIRSWDGVQWQDVPDSFMTNSVFGMLDFNDGQGPGTYFWGRFPGSGGTVINPETTIDTANQSGNIVRWGVSNGPVANYFCDGALGNCPCGNLGMADTGCANSSGLGARILVSGSNSIGTDDMLFVGDQLPAQKPAILFSGLNPANGGAGLLFGDGLLCTTGGIQRYGIDFSDANGGVSWGPGFLAGQFSPGDVRNFQVWFRDPSSGPCGTGFNTSNAAGLTFAP